MLDPSGRDQSIAGQFLRGKKIKQKKNPVTVQ